MDWLVGGMVFSNDSKRLAYGGIRGSKSFLVVDGIQSPEYDAIGHFAFSSDSQHFAYMALLSTRAVIVVDGHVRAESDAIPAGPVFRNDGFLEFLCLDRGALHRVEIPQRVYANSIVNKKASINRIASPTPSTSQRK